MFCFLETFTKVLAWYPWWILRTLWLLKLCLACLSCIIHFNNLKLLLWFCIYFLLAWFCYNVSTAEQSSHTILRSIILTLYNWLWCSMLVWYLSWMSCGFINKSTPLVYVKSLSFLHNFAWWIWSCKWSWPVFLHFLKLSTTLS